MHEVQINVVEASGTRHVYRTQRLMAAVNPPQQGQLRIVETLDTDRQTIHTRLTETAKPFLLKGTGVSLQGNFNIVFKSYQLFYIREYLRDGGCGQNTRRATTKKNAAQSAPLCKR